MDRPATSSLPTGASTSPGSDDGEDDLRHSPLESEHRALDARLVSFGGWLMPLSYPSGTLHEHRSCRADAVVFDVSHLGTVRVEGDKAFALLQQQLTNDLRKVGPGRAQYTHLLDDTDGSVLDDIIVWWRAEDLFDVMPNASNTARVLDSVGGDDVTAERAVLAVQGPGARARLATVWPEAAEVGRFKVAEAVFADQPATVAGTGYTGEDGVECAVPGQVAGELWRMLLATGCVPAGLGARDTLRLEAGLPLHGHELGPGITPLQAGLGWVVGWDKGDFRGRSALEGERSARLSRHLGGLVVEGRQPPRQGAAVRRAGTTVGEVTSGNFSPTLERGIAMAFFDTSAEVTADDALVIDVRGRELAARLSPLPFVGGRKGAA